MTAALVLFDVENYFSIEGNLRDGVYKYIKSRINFNQKFESAHFLVALNVKYFLSINLQTKEPIWTQDKIEKLSKLMGSLCFKNAQITYELLVSSPGPEASDFALIYALGYSSRPDFAGPYQSLYILSADEGLRKSVVQNEQNVLETHGAYPSPIFIQHLKTPISRICCDENRYNSLPEHCTDNTQAGPTFFIENIDDVFHIAHKHTQISGSLYDIAQRALRYPAILSQIGITKSKKSLICAKGVQRLLSYIQTGKAPLLDLAEGELLEYEDRLDQSPDVQLTSDTEIIRIENSPIGPGIVRLFFKKNDQLFNLTVCSNLPANILEFSKTNLTLKKDLSIDSSKVLFNIFNSHISLESVKTACSITMALFVLKQGKEDEIEFVWFGQKKASGVCGSSIKWPKYEDKKSKSILIKCIPEVIRRRGSFELGWKSTISKDLIKSVTINTPANSGRFRIHEIHGHNCVVFHLHETNAGEPLSLLPIQNVNMNFLKNRNREIGNHLKENDFLNLQMCPILVAWKRD